MSLGTIDPLLVLRDHRPFGYCRKLRPNVRCCRVYRISGPLVVGRVEGEVDDRCSVACLSGEDLIRGVASYDLHTMGHARPAAAIDHPDTFTLAHEFVHYRQTYGPGAEDDVKLARCLSSFVSPLHRLVAPLPRSRR